MRQAEGVHGITPHGGTGRRIASACCYLVPIHGLGSWISRDASDRVQFGLCVNYGTVTESNRLCRGFRERSTGSRQWRPEPADADLRSWHGSGGNAAEVRGQAMAGRTWILHRLPRVSAKTLQTVGITGLRAHVADRHAFRYRRLRTFHPLRGLGSFHGSENSDAAH